MKIWLIILLFLGIHSASFGQYKESEVREMATNSSEGEILMHASTLTSEGFLYFAEILADKLLVLNNESSNYHYRKGFLMLEMPF